MFRTALLSLILFVALSTVAAAASSSSIIRRKLSRRQSDQQYCHAIEGFDCKCSYYRVTCTNSRDLTTPINILQDEKQKYQSVELVITAPQDLTINEHTFEPIKDLYKPDADNLEFRVKFENFLGLHLTSPGIFNRVFPDGLPANARKHLALEIYNPTVQPDDNIHLFQNLNADSLELYALFPFRGTFQQLFDGANIKYLRLSGGDIRSDVGQAFTGTVHRLEIAKQANSLSVQDFPVYPAHELIINAFYISEFNSEHPPNYANLGELRVYSQKRIPANAFRQFPNIHTLSVQTDQDIDPHAFDGLNKLEKLTIKDTKTDLDLINKLPNVKELETNIDKLEPDLQCKLIEKLANGQVAVQAIPNGRECTCVSAYLDTATGRPPCNPQDCANSQCAAIRNNYDATTGTFKAPPQIRRSDGSDALRQREPRVYTAPFQVAHQDQEKLQKAQPPPPSVQQPEEDLQRPDGEGSSSWQQPQPPYNPQDSFAHPSGVGHNENERPDTHPSYIPSYDPYPSDNRDSYYETQPPTDPIPYDEIQPATDPMSNNPWYNAGYESTTTSDLNILGPQGGDDRDGDRSTSVYTGDENRPDGDGSENQPGTGVSQPDSDGSTGGVEGGAVDGTDTAAPSKKRMSWLPIIIIAGAIVGLLLIGLLVLFFRKRSTNKGYNQAATSEQRPEHARA